MGVKRLSFTTRYVLLIGVLLLVANTILGLVILSKSKESMTTLIHKDMLDIANSAAGSLDGDVLGALTEQDVDGPIFEDIKRKLTVFQQATDIQFIYAVRQVGEGRYVFTVDPDPVSPGKFGEEVLTTPALVEAAKGTATVDSAPAADRWGNYYSAYSPVFDSTGRVAGVVGLDFDTEWYNEQVLGHTLSIATVTTVSVILAALVVVLITSGVRRRFHDLDRELSKLSSDVDVLMGEMASYSGLEMPLHERDDVATRGGTDEIEVLGAKIRMMQREMGLYLGYLHGRAYTDSLTKVRSSLAYHEEIEKLDGVASDGVSYYVLVFDVNGLKELNDTFGHECGDYYIRGAAAALAEGFGVANVYRVGGDEFCVILQDVDETFVERGIRAVHAAVASFDESSRYPVPLGVSQGMACFTPGRDTSFKDVFARADEAMYEDKRAFYQRKNGVDA